MLSTFKKLTLLFNKTPPSGLTLVEVLIGSSVMAIVLVSFLAGFNQIKTQSQQIILNSDWDQLLELIRSHYADPVRCLQALSPAGSKLTYNPTTNSPITFTQLGVQTDDNSPSNTFLSTTQPINGFQAVSITLQNFPSHQPQPFYSVGYRNLAYFQITANRTTLPSGNPSPDFTSGLISLDAQTQQATPNLIPLLIDTDSNHQLVSCSTTLISGALTYNFFGAGLNQPCQTDGLMVWDMSGLWVCNQTQWNLLPSNTSSTIFPSTASLTQPPVNGQGCVGQEWRVFQDSTGLYACNAYSNPSPTWVQIPSAGHSNFGTSPPGSPPGGDGTNNQNTTNGAGLTIPGNPPMLIPNDSSTQCIQLNGQPGIAVDIHNKSTVYCTFQGDTCPVGTSPYDNGLLNTSTTVACMPN